MNTPTPPHPFQPLLTLSNNRGRKGLQDFPLSNEVIPEDSRDFVYVGTSEADMRHRNSGGTK